MRKLTIWTSTAALAAGGLGLAAAAVADDVGSMPLRTIGANPASYCKGPLQSVCSTVQTTKVGSGTFVLTVFAPAKVPVRAFDLWSGTAPAKLRPKAICAAHGKKSEPQYEEGSFAVTRCTETIPAGHHQTYCFSGLSRIPSTQGGTGYPIYVDAGSAGSDSSFGIPSTTKCPGKVAARRRAAHG